MRHGAPWRAQGEEHSALCLGSQAWIPEAPDEKVHSVRELEMGGLAGVQGRWRLWPCPEDWGTCPLGEGRHDSLSWGWGFKVPFLEIWAEQHPRVGVAWDTVPCPLTSLQQGSKADTTAGWMEHYRKLAHNGDSLSFPDAGCIRYPGIPGRAGSKIHGPLEQLEAAGGLLAWYSQALAALQARLSAVLRLSKRRVPGLYQLTKLRFLQTEDSWCLPHLTRAWIPSRSAAMCLQCGCTRPLDPNGMATSPWGCPLTSGPHLPQLWPQLEERLEIPVLRTCGQAVV